MKESFPKESHSARLKRVAQATVVALDKSFNGSTKEERAAEQKAKQLRSQAEQQRIKDAHESVIAKPTFEVLKANLAYRDWLKNGEKSLWNRSYGGILTEIRDGKPVNPYIPTHVFLSEHINKEISDGAIHESAIKYANQTASNFVVNATDIAKTLVAEKIEYEADPKLKETLMRHAISGLIGIWREEEDETIFKDFSWSTADYTPDFTQLGVGIDELDVPADQIMAGVGLAIGLWVSLADMGATRPISQHDFGPALKHCSFGSLVLETGWADHANVDGLFRNDLRHMHDTPSEDSAFLNMFREPDFFDVTLAELQPAA